MKTVIVFILIWWAAVAQADSPAHVLASVKMHNGNGRCSGTVIGNPAEAERVRIVSAAHCVAGRIGAEATFFNADGTSFQAKLVAFDRTHDLSLFSAKSSDVLAGVMVASWWDRKQATFVGIGYPSGRGPNYKPAKFMAQHPRGTVSEGFAFLVTAGQYQGENVENAYHGGGDSGGGCFVHPTGDGSPAFYFGPITHAAATGGTGATFITTKHADVVKFLESHPIASAGRWYCRRDECRPPYRPAPNIPIDVPPPPIEEAPPVPKDELPAPKPDPIAGPKGERGEPGPEGPAGPQGPPGKDGRDGKDADQAVVLALRNRITALEARIEQLEQQTVGNGESHRVLYFTSRETPTVAETDAMAWRLKNAGQPITIITLKPTQTDVEDIPRIFELPAGRSVVGRAAVLDYLTAL